MPRSRKLFSQLTNGLSPFVMRFISSVTERGIPALFNGRSGINNGAQTVITLRFGNTKLREEEMESQYCPWASH